jgi:hypothetical protein
VRITPGSSSFYVSGPSSSARSVGTISDMGYLVPQPFVAEGNRAITRILGRNWWLAVPRVQDPDTA